MNREYVGYRRFGKKGGKMVVKRVVHPKSDWLNWKDFLPTDIMSGTLDTIVAPNIGTAKARLKFREYKRR